MVHHEPTDPTQGIVTIMTRAHEAAGTLVMEFQRTMPIATSGALIEDRIEAPSRSRCEEA